MKAPVALLTVLSALLACSSASAQVTTIIGGTLGNGDFEATETSGDPAVLVGAQQFIETPNWFNASGSEGINFTQDSQTNGSSQPGSRAGLPFMNRVFFNDTPFTIGAAGENFNITYDFGAGGNVNNWDGDEVLRAFLFTTTVPVDGFLDATTDIVQLGEDLNPIGRAGGVEPQWTTHNSTSFYTSTEADVGSTVYLGFEFLNDNGNSLFPRLDVVNLTTGTPERFLFEFDAGQNPVDGTNEWQPNIDQGLMPDGLPSEFFGFGETATITANVVNDPRVPGITGSYSVGGNGRTPNVAAGAAGEQASSFEVWFKPDSLDGGDQVIAEFGGGLNGSYISLQGDTLSFHTTSSIGDGGSATLSTTLANSEWTQVVANWNGELGEYELFINGVSVDSETGTTIARFSGANQWGLGQVGGDTGDDLAIGGPLSTPASLGELDFAGEIGIFRFYDEQLSAQEVLDAFAAIAAAETGIAGDYNNDGVVNTADYAVWRDNLGAAAGTLLNDADGGTIGTAQFDTWVANFGTSLPDSVAVAVPEPAGLSICLLAAFASACGRRNRSAS